MKNIKIIKKLVFFSIIFLIFNKLIFLGHLLIFVSLKEIHTFFFQKQTHTMRGMKFLHKNIP